MTATAKQPKGSSKSNSATEAQKCIVPNCVRPQFSRGNCAACLINFRRQVDKGLTTWRKLIDAGLVLEPYENKHSPASAAVKKMKKKSNK